MHIINTVVSSNPSHDEVYSILLYIVKMVSEVGALFRILRGFPPPIKLYRHKMTDILFKMTFSTITITIAYAEMEF